MSASSIKAESSGSTGIKRDPGLDEKDSKDGLKTAMDLDKFEDDDDDDDDFEDTGELEIPAQENSAWLTRIPRMVYNSWAEIEDDEPIQLGYLRHYEDSKEYQLFLDSSVSYNQKIPRQYNVQLFNEGTLPNTFLFSEKDLPGFKRRKRAPSSQGGDTKDALGARRGGGFDKPRRFQSFRRSIPKQTALTATAKTEANIIPIQNEETRRILRQRAEAEHASNSGITLLAGDPRQYTSAVLPSGTTGKAVSSFEGFVGNKEPRARPRPQENKAARMPRNELLDALYDCFREYKYWSMRALKTRLNQPEQYLKETVQIIAELQRSGDFASHYRLKPEAEEQHIAIPPAEEGAPELGEDDEERGAESGVGDDSVAGDEDLDMADMPE